MTNLATKIATNLKDTVNFNLYHVWANIFLERMKIIFILYA